MSVKIIHSETAPEAWFEEGCFIQEIGNSPADPSVSVARARVRPGECTQWHVLDGVFERYLVTSGVGRVEVGDLAPARVTAGDLVLIPPGVRQRISNEGETDLVFYAICTPRFTQACYRRLESPPG